MAASKRQLHTLLEDELGNRFTNPEQLKVELDRLTTGARGCWGLQTCSTCCTLPSSAIIPCMEHATSHHHSFTFSKNARNMSHVATL